MNKRCFKGKCSSAAEVVDRSRVNVASCAFILPLSKACQEILLCSNGGKWLSSSRNIFMASFFLLLRLWLWFGVWFWCPFFLVFSCICCFCLLGGSFFFGCLAYHYIPFVPLSVFNRKLYYISKKKKKHLDAIPVVVWAKLICIIHFYPFFFCSGIYSHTHSTHPSQALPSTLQSGIDHWLFMLKGGALPLSYKWIGKKLLAFDAYFNI